MLVCEVALGQMAILSSSDSNLTAPPNDKKSVMGFGKYRPDKKENKYLRDGTRIPIGKPLLRDGINATSLDYNEFIIYDEAQVNIRYVVRAKFG